VLPSQICVFRIRMSGDLELQTASNARPVSGPQQDFAAQTRSEDTEACEDGMFQGWKLLQQHRKHDSYRFPFRGCVLLLMMLCMALLQAKSVIGQYAVSGMPEYAQEEAQLVVDGDGCVLDCIAVYNRACALISETLPFYYFDEETKTVMENASKAETAIKWQESFEFGLKVYYAH
jgi:hypothetical protein